MADVTPIYKMAGRLGISKIFVGDNKTHLLPQPKRLINEQGYVNWRAFGSVYVISPPALQAEWLGQGSAGAGAGSGTGSRTGAGGGALAATQQGPSYTGGGAYFPIGAVENQAAGVSQRDDEFEGIDTFNPDERLAPGRTPWGPNWDGLRRIGSRCVRSGTAKLDDDRDSVDIISSSISADYRGLSIAAMPGSGDNTNRLLLCFADNAIGGTRTAQVTTLHLTNTTLRWGRPLDLRGWPGPKIALSDQGGQVLRVTTDYTNVFSTANDGLRNATVKQLVIRYSTTGYPLDKDAVDSDGSVLLADHITWAGASRTDDSGTLTAARYYVSAWAVSVLGVSEPSHASLTLA